MGMPRYWFHIRDNEKVIPDEEGMSFPDLDAAKGEAHASALGMLSDAMDESEDISHQVIEVTAADGGVLLVIELRGFAGSPVLAA